MKIKEIAELYRALDLASKWARADHANEPLHSRFKKRLIEGLEKLEKEDGTSITGN